MMTPEEKVAHIREKAQAYVEAKKVEAIQAQIKVYEMQLERIKKDPSLLEGKVTVSRSQS